MLADAKNLGDPRAATTGTPDWVPAFKNGVDGMILVSGESHGTVAEKLSEVEKIFLVGAHAATIHEALRIVGDVRPGEEKGHEQFVTPINLQDSSSANIREQLWLPRWHLAACDPWCQCDKSTWAGVRESRSNTSWPRRRYQLDDQRIGLSASLGFRWELPCLSLSLPACPWIQRLLETKPDPWFSS